MDLNIATIDLLIILVYIIIVLSIGFYFRKRSRNSEEYFLAGRSIGWVAIGASLFATNISSEHFLGLAGTGSKSGLAVGQFEWLACLILLLLGWVFTPFYLKSGVFTMPEFLERRYNASSRYYLSIISIIGYVLTKISIALYAGGILLNAVVGWDMYTAAVVIVLITGLYTVMGGLSAVIYTDLVQTVILIGGSVALTLIGLDRAGGWDSLVVNTPADFWSVFKPLSDPDFPWTGIIFGAPILGIWYWCTDQYIVQRVLSAKNLSNAQSGTIFAGFLKILPVFILVLPGIIAFYISDGNPVDYVNYQSAFEHIRHVRTVLEDMGIDFYTVGLHNPLFTDEAEKEFLDRIYGAGKYVNVDRHDKREESLVELFSTVISQI